MSRALETYKGYDIITGSPEYGKQFAIAYVLTDGEGHLHFCFTIEEAKAEIDDECEFPRSLRL